MNLSRKLDIPITVELLHITDYPEFIRRRRKTDETDATDTISPISSKQITFKGFELSEVVGYTAHSHT